MINFDGREVEHEFAEAFKDVFIYNPATEDYQSILIQDLTPKQLWWLTKFAKHVRGRCRNNSAFNNYMNRNFSPAHFKEVPKEYNRRSYMGLSISKDGISLDNDNEGE